LVLCDEEEEYAQLMSEFLRKHRKLPWELRTYTSVEELLEREKGGIELLVVAESAFSDRLRRLSPGRLVVLSESGVMRWEDVCYVDKYSRAQEVLGQLLAIYAEAEAEEQPPRLEPEIHTKIIGNYSPVRRSFQTSFALTMGQMLAQEHRTLYLNFEHYAGMGELLPDMQTYDLADLLYFMNAGKEKFRIRLQSMMKQIGNLDYIPPMRSGQNLLSVTGEEWQSFLQKIQDLGEYEYVILDLSESMQGLFEILRQCSRIFTSGAKDRVGERKLMQYEQILALYDYGDVLEKTCRTDLSHIRRIPAEPEQLTHGELAEVVRSYIREL
jgi:hypothetical protein